MNRNYLLIAIRNFWRHKLLSVINIAGLAIGISASLIIYLMVSFEFSFDRFHPDGDRIYRVVSRIDFPDLTIHNSGVPVPTSDALREEGTGIESVTHFITPQQFKVAVPDASGKSPRLFRKQDHIIYADPYYFDIFQYRWLAGSKAGNLNAPFQLVLSESRANIYFPGVSLNEIVGRELVYDDSLKITVTGIVGDFEQNSDLVFKEFISRSTIEHTGIRNHWNWKDWGSINSSSQLFVKLASDVAPDRIRQQLLKIREKHRTKREGEEKDDTKHFLQQLSEIHFSLNYDAFEQRLGHKPTLYGLLAVAGFLLLLGCINFINLSTAQASTRAKEIGIRKTLGGSRHQLIWQFLSETFVLTILATLLSIMITPWLLLIFGNFIPPQIGFSSLNQWHVWLFLFSLVLIVSFLSGYYPALVLSRFQPVTVMKNHFVHSSPKGSRAWLRKTLTVTQFMIAQLLLIATLVVSKQVHYSLNKDLGYKKEAIVFFNAPWNHFSEEPDNRKLILFEKIKHMPEIETISLSGMAPASGGTSTTTMAYWNGKKNIETMVEVKYADTNYFRLYGMKLLAGKNLQQSDTTKEFVINETYAKLLGFNDPEAAIGKVIHRDSDIPVTGVIADFHTKSTHEAIKPLAYSSALKNSHTIHIALRTGRNQADSWKTGLSNIGEAFKDVYPEEDFSYQFFDQSIAKFYETEKNISGLLKWAAGLCLMISSLGLLGLVIFTTNSRTKEIGVRKILGASVTQIVLLLSRDFISLVLVAFLFVTPVSWIIMSNWLQNFVYRTDLSWWLFALSGAFMLFIAMITLSIRTIRSASENPVNSLRSE